MHINSLLSQKAVWLVYDGECPFCSLTAKNIKIRKALGEFHLINAREDHPLMDEINRAGLDINEGIIVKFENALYHGADALHLLAMISTPSDWFNRLNVLVFRNQFVAKLLYPVLKFLRKLLLWIRSK